MSRSFSELIGHLYDGIADPAGFRAALEALRRALDANFVTLAFVTRTPKRAEATVSAGEVPLDRLVRYQNEYQRFAPRLERGPGDVRTINAWRTSGAHDDIGRFEELLELSDIDHYMGAWLASNDEVDCFLRVTRPRGAPPFSPDDTSLLELVAPHVARAFEIRSRLERAEARMEVDNEALDRLSVGAIVLDERGRVTAQNAVAARVLSARDGLEVVDATLRASADAGRAAFAATLAEARATEPGTRGASLRLVSLERGGGKAALGVAVCPMRFGGGLDGRPRHGVAVFLRDPDTSLGVDAPALVALFGLTPAEAKLALELVKGRSLEQSATILDIRYNTARAHLRSIFAKTGVTRQAELVRVVLASPAALSSARDQ